MAGSLERRLRELSRKWRALYGFLDDALCLMSCLGWRPVWYKEWWAR